MFKMLSSALCGLWLVSSPALAAQFKPTAVVSDIQDGEACKMAFKVSAVRTPAVSGTPLGTVPDDVYLSLVQVSDPENPLCQRAMAARRIVMNRAEEQLPGVEFSYGDRLSTTVLYQQFMHGGIPYDAYHYVMVIEGGVGAPALFEDLEIQP